MDWIQKQRDSQAPLTSAAQAALWWLRLHYLAESIDQNIVIVSDAAEPDRKQSKAQVNTLA